MHSISRSCGLHLRLENSYYKTAQKAAELGLDSFQIFALPDKKARYLEPEPEDQKAFLSLRNSFKKIYLHSNYKINLASGNRKHQKLSSIFFAKELRIAKLLNLDGVVVHCGHAVSFRTKTNLRKQGIAAFCERIAQALEHVNNVPILIENGAHGKTSIGSDLRDFTMIEKILESTQRVAYCIDSAHAFVYGYDVTNTESFIQEIACTIGLDRVALLHLNDAQAACASKLDAHALPGAGNIGKEALLALAHHPKLAHIPIIVEPSSRDENDSIEIVKELL